MLISGRAIGQRSDQRGGGISQPTGPRGIRSFSKAPASVILARYWAKFSVFPQDIIIPKRNKVRLDHKAAHPPEKVVPAVLIQH